MRNNKGLAEVAILTYIIIGLALLFVPNPLSSSLGVGIRPNKTIQTEKVELIRDKDGNPIAYKTTSSDKDIQQQVTLWEQIRSLPILILLLSGLGVIFTPIAVFLQKVKSSLLNDTKRIVRGVDAAMDEVKDEELKKRMYLEMGNAQDQSTKDLVDKAQGKK